jgi:hypothetical protein
MNGQPQGTTGTGQEQNTGTPGQDLNSFNSEPGQNINTSVRERLNTMPAGRDDGSQLKTVMKQIKKTV